MTSDSHAILTSEQAALLAALLQPLERADRAIGREPGPFRFETNSGYRDLSREDLSNAAQVYRTLQSAALASTAGAGAGDWQPLSLLAPQTNAMLGRWCRCGDREDGSEHWYWQQAFGRYFDFQGERHWCLDGHQFEAGPFYGEAPTHFFAVASAPSRQSPAVPASPRSETVWDYTHALQSVIWRICNGHPITDDLIKRAPHAAGMAAKFMAASPPAPLTSKEDRT